MELWCLVQAAVAKAVPGLSAGDIRVPARSAPCDCYLPAPPPLTPESFGTLLGAPLVSELRWKNGRMLLDFTDGFYTACVAWANEALPLPGSDHGDFCLNRMLLAARQGGGGCPSRPKMQRALWLCAGASASSAMARDARQAYLTAFRCLEPAERQAMLRECGAFSAACARLYGAAYSSQAL